MTDLTLEPTSTLPLAPPGPCAACTVVIQPGEPYAYVAEAPARQHGLVCASCWNAGRGAIVEAGAERQQQPPDTEPPPASR